MYRTDIDAIDHWGFWEGQSGIEDKIQLLHWMLENYALSPDFRCYGFYEKDAKNARNEVIKPGFWTFFGNFADAACVFNFDSNDPAVVEPMIAAIEKNLASDEYKRVEQEHHKFFAEQKRRRERQEAARRADEIRRAHATLRA